MTRDDEVPLWCSRRFEYACSGQPEGLREDGPERVLRFPDIAKEDLKDRGAVRRRTRRLMGKGRRLEDDRFGFDDDITWLPAAAGVMQ